MMCPLRTAVSGRSGTVQHACGKSVFVFQRPTIWALDSPGSHVRIVVDTQDAHGSPLRHPLKSVQVLCFNSKRVWIRLWGTSIRKQ